MVTQYFWPEDFRINELVAELARRGHEITVLTGKPNYPAGRIFPDFQEDPARFASYEGARIVRVPVLPRGVGKLRLFANYVSFAVSATLAGIPRVWNERFDAMLVFQPSPITVGIPAIALRRLKRWPVAFWVLDHWPETLSAVGAVKSKAVLGLVGRLASFIYSRCDLLLSPSRSLAAQIGKYCDDAGRIAYFPNWVEAAYGSAATPASEIAVRTDVFTVMFAGNVGEAQDFGTILDAVERLKTRAVRWVIVGEGRMAAWVAGEVDRRGLQEKVILAGRYPSARMPSFYAHADALLVSLKPDPLFSMMIPGKLQSYLGSGLPVVGMLDGEGARIIEEARAGVTCPPGDSAALADAVLRVAALGDAERSAMGVNGRSYTRREFDREALVARLEEWLTELGRGSVPGRTAHG